MQPREGLSVCTSQHAGWGVNPACPRRFCWDLKVVILWPNVSSLYLLQSKNLHTYGRECLALWEVAMLSEWEEYGIGVMHVNRGLH